MLQSGHWTKWPPEVLFNLIYSMILPWHLLKSEYLVTDLSPRPCRVFLSITLASSQLDHSYYSNIASASVINGIACKESMILAIWDYVINTSTRKKKVLLGNNCHSSLFQPSERVLQIVIHCLYIKKVKPYHTYVICIILLPWTGQI